MWGLFFASAFVEALFIFTPGFFFLRAFGIPRVISLAGAPAITVLAYSILGIVYPLVGVACSWTTLVGPTLATSFVIFLLGKLVLRGKALDCGLESASVKCFKHPRYYNAACLALYVIMGVVVTTTFMLGSFDTPASFSQEYDNVHHLGVTRAFLDSGDWSSFNPTLYSTTADDAINPLPGVGFYPSAWNVLAALVGSAVGVSAPFAANVVNYVLIALVFPSGMFLLLRGLFKDNPTIVVFGSLCVLAFAAFPWDFLTFGPLYPNLLAFSLVPLAAFFFVAIFFSGIRILSRVVLILLFCVVMGCMALSQPNGVFSLAVFLAPFCVYQASRIVELKPVKGAGRVILRVVFGLLAAVAIGAIWYALFTAPFMRGVVSFVWPAYESSPEALLNALNFSFKYPAAQWVLTCLVLVGSAYTLVQRKYFWITCSYAIAVLIFVVDASMDGFWKHLLSGFWYTDVHRVSAMVTLFAVPLAGIGLWLCARSAAWLLEKLFCRSKHAKVVWPLLVSTSVISMAFLILNFYPVLSQSSDFEGELNTGYSRMAKYAEKKYSDGELVMYDAEERSFAEKVKHVVPDDALIVNVPDDGSVYAYSAHDLNVYYRYLSTYGVSDETNDSKVIRNGMVRIASDPLVQQAARNVGVEYVLVLDQGEQLRKRRYLYTYENGKSWKGLLSIRDDTPGFEVVLKEGDMRLYKISPQALRAEQPLAYQPD